jgi:signal transduction histidine kinase
MRSVGLRLRLSLVIMVPLVLVLGVYGALRLRYEQQELLADNQRLIGLTAKAVQISVENALRDRQMSDIQRFLTALVEGQEQIDRIRLFNHALQPTLVSNPLSIPEHVPDAALRKVLETGRVDWFYAQRGRQSVLYYIVPLRGVDGRTAGAIEIVQLASGVEDRVRAAMWDVVIRLSTLLLSVGLVTGFVLQRQVLRPIARLMEGIRRVGEGEAGSRLPVERSDELGRVAAAFNTMATRLETARARLVEESERALELERQVRHAQTVAVAGRLATALAHEIGTPLNIISGRAETVLRELPANDRRREELTVIVEQIDRIVGMIRALLDTVRPAKPEIRSVDIGGVVGGLLPLLRHAARVKGQTLVADLPPRLPAVLADANQLQQLIINLVVNAVEAAPDGGEVRIHAVTAPDAGRAGVRVTVHDTGPGIPPELRGRVFQPFFTTKPPGRGTGLGLTICRDIVKEHGGTIRIDDTDDGGAAVAIWLPIAEAAA